MKKVTFWYVRHGETLFNRIGKMQGWSDSPLSEKGLRDAYDAKDALMGISIDRIYTSTSERCVDTALIIIEERDIPIFFEKGLKEINFGLYEGATIRNHQEDIDERRFHTYDWSDVEGEDPAMVKERIRKTYGRIYNESKDGDTVLIVSHGAIFFHMLKYLFGYDQKYYLDLIMDGPAEDLPIPNGLAAVFTMSEEGNEVTELFKRDPQLLEELRRRSKDNV